MSALPRTHRSGLLPGLGLVGMVCALCWGAWVRPSPISGWRDARLPRPVLTEVEGLLRADVPPGFRVHYTLDGRVPDARSPVLEVGLAHRVQGSARLAARYLSTPTSIQWRAPVGPFPLLTVVRAAACNGQGVCGPAVMHTMGTPGTHALPVVSLALPAGSFFDPDTGLHVVGHAMMHGAVANVQDYERQQRWWSYPGNYHGRGRHWERDAQLAMHDPQGRLLWRTDAGLRIHGNNTRGFPQHAMRVLANGAQEGSPFGDGVLRHAVVLRSAGNDQDRGFMRDALLHRICAPAGLETSASRPVVVHVNGAYWGIYHLRERTDERELARRHGLDHKQIAILEDRAVPYRGGQRWAGVFLDMLDRFEAMDPLAEDFVARVDAELAVDHFLRYMAAQMIVANVDWPDQNLRYWRWTGAVDSINRMTDGRWRFIMGDSDLGFGHVGDVQYDMIAHVRQRHTPVARLHKALIRSPELHGRFIAAANELLAGALSAEAMTDALDGLAAELRPAMSTHVSRWRRPRSVATWERHVALMRSFAQERPAVFAAHLRRMAPPAKQATP